MIALIFFTILIVLLGNLFHQVGLMIGLGLFFAYACFAEYLVHREDFPKPKKDLKK